MSGPDRTLPPHPGLADGPVYPDCNGTTPLAPRVAESMRPYLTDFDADDLIADLTQVLDAG